MSQPLLLLDCETTGLDGSRLLELAYAPVVVSHEAVTAFMVKPPVAIELEAMAVNHITEAMVASLAPFKDREDYRAVKELIESSIVVAHNASFDVGVLKREGIHVKKFIDTKRCAIYAFPTIKKQNLQYLRYALGLEVDAEAHSAGGDVRILGALFKRIREVIKDDELEEFVECV